MPKIKPNRPRVSARRFAQDNGTPQPVKKKATTDDQLVWCPPVVANDPAYSLHTWTTECGRYRVHRQVMTRTSEDRTKSLSDRFVGERLVVTEHRFDGGGHRLPEGKTIRRTSWDFTELRPEGYYPREFRTLAEALQSCETRHCLLTRKRSVETNAEQVVIDANGLGLAKLVVERSEAQQAATVELVERTKERKAKPVQVADLDPFGNRRGSVIARLCAALTKKPKSMRQLVDEIGVNWQTTSPMNKLVATGKIGGTSKGYFLL